MKKSTKTVLFLTSVCTIFLPIMLIFLFKGNDFGTNNSASDFYIGCDLSSILEVEENGTIFHNENGLEEDIFKILKKYISFNFI